jgi:hypothetical protein
MSPVTHLFASWLIAAKTTHNPRDCRLVALAGILPDIDGLGMIADIGARLMGNEQTWYYGRYHHVWTHGGFGAAIIVAFLTCFAKERLRVALLSLVTFHLHVLCDLAGSRGPSKEDLWPIYYFGPFTKEPMWLWKGQWPLFAWPNRLLTVGLFSWCLWLPIQGGHSVVGVFNRRADAVFVGVLRGWRDSWRRRLKSVRKDSD